MKEIVPPIPVVVRNEHASIVEMYDRNVVPSYGRFPIAFSHGLGSRLWDVGGRAYLDLGGGIAVTALGHANPEVTNALIEQSRKLLHVSNLYYTDAQGRLAQKLVSLIGPGKVFFCNSGAEANEGLYKVARKFGHDTGRYEIITTINSFHGRTLGGIAATGQDKVKKGFEPIIPGFSHVPYNDLAAMRAAITPCTAAILIEGIQGESGVTPATPEYLLGLRQLCNERNILLLMDSVQCGHFRTGRFQSYQRILEGVPGGQGFIPDGISMAKSLGGGFPIGAFWLRDPYGSLLSAGTHGTTFGGNLLGCAVALKIIDVIERENLAQNARDLGEWWIEKIGDLVAQFPSVLKTVRGYGLMIGIEFQPEIPALQKSDKPAALQIVQRLHDRGVLTIPSGTQIIRLIPALNLLQSEAEEGLAAIAALVRELA